jgi:inorganic phosphate transporter, PiT family
MIDIVVWIVVLGLLFDYTNGLHDAANVVSTSIATKVLRPMTAIFMATVFNFLGATQVSQVVHTVTTGLVDPTKVSELMVLSAIMGAIFWNFLTWNFGIPSSSSYAIVGGLVGSAWVGGGSSIIIWNGFFYKVIIPMVLSPFIGFLIALFFMRGLMKIARRDNSIFKYFQICSAGGVALAHGLNDAQKSMGIIMLGLVTAGFVKASYVPPLWVIGSCATMMALGIATGGFRIIRTIGFEITKLDISQGFIAESSAFMVILGASFFGMPLSSTHIIVGSIIGVGMARGAQCIRWNTIKKVVLAWVITIPGSAAASFCFFKLFEIFFK